MQLSGMTEGVAKALKKKSVNSLHYLLRQSKKAQESCLRQAFDSIESSSIPTELLKKLDSIPQLRVDNIRVREYKEEVKSRDVGWMELESNGLLTIPSNADCEVEIKISTTLPQGRDNNKHFGSQKKDASWWIVLVQTDEDLLASTVPEEDSNITTEGVRSEGTKKKIATKRIKLPIEEADLVAMKRVGSIRDHVTVNLLFSAPVEAIAWPLRLYLVNDTFVGADVMVTMQQCKTY